MSGVGIDPRALELLESEIELVGSIQGDLISEEQASIVGNDRFSRVFITQCDRNSLEEFAIGPEDERIESFSDDRFLGKHDLILPFLGRNEQTGTLSRFETPDSEFDAVVTLYIPEDFVFQGDKEMKQACLRIDGVFDKLHLQIDSIE